ncbi:MAG: serine/threonine protein kinase, partial [Bacteroidota bacterium]
MAEQIGGYEVIAEITRGLSARVVLAQAPGSTELVAIKQLLIESDSGLSEEEQIARFRRESEIHLHLSHPHIVRAIEASGEGEDGDKRLYLVQEYQHGTSWQKMLKSREYTLIEILELGVQLCDALHFMHEQGIVHRDITPANLLISPAGQLKITDFGMARRAFAPGITQAKMMLGTLNYMSPEQLIDATAVDGRTDVFAAGVILYRSLVGQLPFAAENPSDMAHRLLYAEPPDPLELNPDLPPSLAQKLLKCLAKDPDFRYLSSESLRKDLHDELQNPGLYLAQGKI